ncbi:hypothetical protein DCAR_0934463 [Daucus carota subsp. sativus]|uniref:Retrotransposon gag domain-containing protein n=2 Tax=Daucus carota subsp. sativus TaxID=79200 RepID=A0AAF1BEC6_DAUCS|nr:hypothetical protein DCAR_0934463 [Daucus carota subsp. sativus]
MDFVTSAQDLLEELHDQFSSVNGHRIYQVLKDLHALEQGDKSVEIYYHKMKNLWDEYAVLDAVDGCKGGCTCGNLKIQEAKEQRKKLLQFLMGLNDSYASARGQILMMSPLPSIPQAFSLIKQDEKQKQGSHTAMPFLANAVDASKSNSVNSRNQGSKSSLKCTYCNKDGHTREQCYKLIGYPDKKKGKNKPASTGTTGFRPLPQVASSNHVDVLTSSSGVQGNYAGSSASSNSASCNSAPTLEQLQS